MAALSMCRLLRISSVGRLHLGRFFAPYLSTDAKSAPPNPDLQADPESTMVEQIKNLKLELDQLTHNHTELEEKYKRALAESENMRKRFMRQIDEAKIFGIQGFCKDLLEVADVLMTATESAPQDQLKPDVNPSFLNLYEGLKMTEQQLLQVFARHSLHQIHPLEGERFDPNYHEAVFQASLQPGKEPNTIATVTKIGYKLHGRTLRPAFVGVFGST